MGLLSGKESPPHERRKSDLGLGYEGSYLLAAALRVSGACWVLLSGCCFVVVVRFLRLVILAYRRSFSLFLFLTVSYYFK